MVAICQHPCNKYDNHLLYRAAYFFIFYTPFNYHLQFDQFTEKNVKSRIYFQGSSSLFITIPMSIHVYSCPSMSIHVHPCLFMSIRVYSCPSMSIHVHPCLFMSIHVYSCPSVSIHVYPCQLLHISLEQQEYRRS